MSWFSGRRRQTTQALAGTAQTTTSTAPTAASAQSSVAAKVDETIAAAETLLGVAEAAIRANLDQASAIWRCDEFLVLDRDAIKALLNRVAETDLMLDFDRFEVSKRPEGDDGQPPYVQLNSIGGTWRPYRLVKREDGQLVLYGHAALYLVKRIMDRTADLKAVSTEDLIKELIDIGRTQGLLLASRGTEFREHIKAIGSALDARGGMKLMVQEYEAVRESLGPVQARGLENGLGRRRRLARLVSCAGESVQIFGE